MAARSSSETEMIGRASGMMSARACGIVSTLDGPTIRSAQFTLSGPVGSTREYSTACEETAAEPESDDGCDGEVFTASVVGTDVDEVGEMSRHCDDATGDISSTSGGDGITLDGSTIRQPVLEQVAPVGPTRDVLPRVGDELAGRDRLI